MRNSLERVVTIVVGGLVLFAAYRFWFGSGIFNGWFAPSVESGKLGAGGADFMSQALEIVFTVLSTVGTVVLAIVFKLVSYIAGAFEGTAQQFARRNPVTLQQGDVPEVGVVDSGIRIERPHINEKQRGDYTRVLLQAVVEGDAGLVVAMAERIHGKPFLRTTKKPKPSQSEGGFPTKTENV